MDFPLLLLVLLALPFAATALILAVSAVRRRDQVPGDGAPMHRMQSDTAAVQDAEVQRPRAARSVTSGRERRAASGAEPTKD